MANPDTVFSLLDDVDKLVEQLEAVCFDPNADPTRTQDARVRRIQLLDVAEVLRGRKRHLDFI